MTILYIILGVLILYVLFTYNSFIRLRNQVVNSFSGIDVQLKRRNDLVPNLIGVVKGYAKHEKSLFESIAKTRSALSSALEKQDLQKVSKDDAVLSSSLKSVLAVAENYPALKANENFLDLQKKIARIENQIAAARRIYNANVTIFNTKLELFPNNIFNKLAKFSQFELYSLEDGQKQVKKFEH